MDVNELNEARNRTIATNARRLAKTTQLDFADAILEAQTAVWIVEQRPSMDPAKYGFAGVAHQAHLLAVDQILSDEGHYRGTDNRRRRRTVSMPSDYEAVDPNPTPDCLSEWDELVAEFLERVRGSIRGSDPTAVWVVDAVENGYRTATELGEWRRRFGYGTERLECKRVYELFLRHSRAAFERQAEREGDSF